MLNKLFRLPSFPPPLLSRTSPSTRAPDRTPWNVSVSRLWCCSALSVCRCDAGLLSGVLVWHMDGNLMFDSAVVFSIFWFVQQLQGSLWSSYCIRSFRSCRQWPNWVLLCRWQCFPKSSEVWLFTNCLLKLNLCSVTCFSTKHFVGAFSLPNLNSVLSKSVAMPTVACAD